MALPLCKWGCMDRLFWWYNKDGRYSVISGYWPARSIHPHHNNPATLGDDHILWQKIWGLSGPPKLQHLLWRGCRNSLPVNEVRKHRHLAETDTCARCLAGYRSSSGFVWGRSGTSHGIQPNTFRGECHECHQCYIEAA